MSVWDELVGQDRVVEILRRAVAGDAHSMTHAWLVTGPPGSGRSNAARAFAAALQCVQGGCGECNACRTSLSGAHPDVTLVRTEQLSIGVEEARGLARKASMRPTMGRHQVLVVEDADRVTERGADALLKSIEEPGERTVWLLCAPTAEDVIATIRSRCRQVRLATPSDEAVAALLVRRDGVDPPLAAYAARAAQGHIGRARALARDESVRNRRAEVLRIPGALVSVGECLRAADLLVKSTAEDAERATADVSARERAALNEALGFGTKGARPRNTQAAIKELEDEQKARVKRSQRDALDRILSEFTSWYRDVLALQTSAIGPGAKGTGINATGPNLINPDLRAGLESAARSASPEATLRRIDAILACREALETNVAPLLAVEALLLNLADPG
ncbi:MAG TPA: DNA polymerase III subunit delta' [Propionibacteriaceae bacterium]|nr:DNA polymerase III subunit delta' [Propionibacteriaceae bacterium]